MYVICGLWQLNLPFWNKKDKTEEETKQKLSRFRLLSEEWRIWLLLIMWLYRKETAEEAEGQRGGNLWRRFGDGGGGGVPEGARAGRRRRRREEEREEWKEDQEAKRREAAGGIELWRGGKKAGKEEAKEGKEFYFQKKRFRRERLRIEMKTETEANFSRSIALWKIRISFLLKKEIKTRNLFLFMHQRKAEKAGFGSG